MTELRCRKTETLDEEKEDDEVQDKCDEVTTNDVKEPSSTEDKEGSNEQQPKEEEDTSGQESDAPEQPEKKCRRKGTFVQRLLRVLFGCVAAVACGTLYAAYLSAYHDRKFWFSARQELEREITFQAGSGMYYYYYKQMLAAPSFQRGFYELTVDNRTVSGQTINAVERLSLYPELLTSLTYKLFECEVRPFSFTIYPSFSKSIYLLIFFSLKFIDNVIS